MSSLPPRQPHVDPHNLTNAQNLQHATKKVNSLARRDPALYPLSIVVCGMIGVAGYFFMTKAANPDASKSFMQNDSVVQPWDANTDTHPSATAAFKYRYKTRQGHMEDSLPALNQDSRILKEAAAHRYHAS